MCDAGVFAIWCVVTVNVNPRPLYPQKRTLLRASRDVRFVPKADSRTAAINAKLKRGSAYRNLPG